jgi:hypothetical protein
MQPANFSHISRRPLPLPKDGLDYYWHIENFTSDLPKEYVVKAFTQAMNVWQYGFDRVYPEGNWVSLMPTKELSKADIIISFGKHIHQFKDSEGTTHTCQFSFDGEQGVIAHAFTFTLKNEYSGQMHCDDSELWSDRYGFINGRHHTDCFTPFLHEFGHLMDLDHSEVDEAVMGAVYTGPVLQLHEDDHKGLELKFSPLKIIIAGKRGWLPDKNSKPHPKHLGPLERIFKWFTSLL